MLGGRGGPIRANQFRNTVSMPVTQSLLFRGSVAVRRWYDRKSFYVLSTSYLQQSQHDSCYPPSGLSSLRYVDKIP